MAETRGDVAAVAEWWALATARFGWVLTRGSSYGLTAAALGMAGGGGAQVYTVYEHKVSGCFGCGSRAGVRAE